MNPLSRLMPLVAAAEVALLSFTTYAAAPAKDGDLVLVGTVWKGKLTQKGEYMGAGGVPPEFDCVFTVTKRDGETFEAELFEKTPDLKLTYVVKGTIKPADPKDKGKGYRIEWESFDAKGVEGTTAVTKIPYAGTVKDRTMKGSWKHPANDEGATLAGEFEFELSGKKE